MRHQIISLALAALLCNGSAQGSEPPEEWLVRPGDGIGRFHGTVTYAQARRLYPEASLVIEKAYIGFKLPVKLRGLLEYPTANYFVFRKNGEELFRAECDCNPTQKAEGDESWKHGPGDDLERRIIHPIFLNPRFRTKEGIHVGSTVRDLRQAYPNAPPLFAIRGSTEFACFGASVSTTKWASNPTITKVAFYLNPAPGKEYAGEYTNHDYTKLVDDNAEIIAIDANGGCTLPENDGPED